MSAEYQPETRLRASRAKLHRVATTQVEISDQTLYEGVLDVLASRGGRRWKNLDELWLKTKSAAIDLVVGYRSGHPSRYVFIETTQQDQVRGRYRIVREPGDTTRPDIPDIYELRSLDPREDFDDDRFEAVSNQGSLGPARLFAILDDAHSHTPKERLTRSTYSA